MIGSLTGAFIYLLFPEMGILIILTLLLLLMSWESGKKYFDLVKKEKKQDEEKANGDKQQNSDKEVEMNDLQVTCERAKESGVSDEAENKEDQEQNHQQQLTIKLKICKCP